MPKKGYQKSAAEKAHNRAYMREYTKRHPQDPAYNCMRKLYARYGLTKDEWELLFTLQGRRCALCQSMVSGGKGWHTDHSHKTGKIRGILCWPCNAGLGQFKENKAAFKAAIAYLDGED